MSAARLHECSVCGKRETWDESKWQWWGSYKDIDDGNPVVKMCSDVCRRKARAKGIVLRDVMDLRDAP